MSARAQHVVPNGGKWSVRKSGAAKVSVTYGTQHEAIARAKEIARNLGTELYIHGADGRIRERMSYSSDPMTPKG